MELHWKDCEKMNELKVGFDVYTYTPVINTHFNMGNVFFLLLFFH